MRYFIVLTGIFVLLSVSNSAWACSCAMSKGPEEGFNRADAVFTTQVTDITEDTHGNPKNVIFKTGKVWKGEPEKKFLIPTLRNMCAYQSFEKDKEYLVYAYKSRDPAHPNKLEVSSCSRTKPLEQGRVEARYLDAIVAGKGAQEVTQRLPHILTDMTEPPNVRAEAAQLLGSLSIQNSEVSSDVVAALVKATYDIDSTVQKAAAQGLGSNHRHGKPEVKQALLDLLKNDDIDLSTSAASSLSRVAGKDAEVFQALVQALGRPYKKDGEHKKAYEGRLTVLAAALVAVSGTPAEKKQAVDLIIPMIDQVEDPYSRVGIIQHLGFLHGHARKAFPKILEILKSSDHYHVRQYALSSLADMGATEALPEIKTYLKDPNCYVVKHTVEAVHKLDPEGFPAFFKTVAMPEMEARFNACQREFLWALRTLGRSAHDMREFLRERHKALPDSDGLKNDIEQVIDGLEG